MYEQKSTAAIIDDERPAVLYSTGTGTAFTGMFSFKTSVFFLVLRAGLEIVQEWGLFQTFRKTSTFETSYQSKLKQK